LEEGAFGLVIDLSDDHRFDRGWVYGLTEFGRPGLVGAPRIANPGCYPTATLLALVPFVRAGLVEGPLVIDAISGYSGAGRAAEDRLSLATGSGGVTAYGGVDHRHVGEMERGLAAFGGAEHVVSFTPHLAPMPRGLLVTARAELGISMDDGAALEELRHSYSREPFVDVTAEWPTTKAVIGSNRAVVSARVDPRAGLLIVSCAIDNLGKGAAGQAIQNANVALGIEETAGLSGLGVWP
jgi:N-acetyl-gamma-glutamyl-phosphate reductase